MGKKKYKSYKVVSEGVSTKRPLPPEPSNDKHTKKTEVKDEKENEKE